jgi:hypothetical protein
MSQLLLPDRPLKLARKARPGYFGALFGALVLLVIGGFLLVWQLPGLQHDWKISRNPVVVLDGDIQDAKCTTRKAIFTDCEAHLAYSVDGKSYESDVSLMFVDFHTGDYMVDLVRSGDEPALSTMSIGIEKLWNRVGLLVFLLLCTLGGGLVLLWQGAKNMRASGQMVGSARMAVVPVTIERVTTTGSKTNITIRDPSGVRPRAKYVSVFGKSEAPLIMPDGRGIAVRLEGTTTPVLLDRGLERLDLTASERAAALASVGA